MASNSRSLLRACVTWLRVVLPPWWAVVSFVVVLAGLELLAHSMLRGTSDWDNRREFILLAHSPRDIWLAGALALYGLFRVLARHPMFRPAYAEWLAGTPWHGQLALPLGPVHLVPQDGLVLLAAWLVSRHDSHFDSAAVATIFLLPYLLALIVALRAGGAAAHAYLVAFGLAIAVLLGLPSPASAPLLIPLYLIGWHGLPRSLRGVALNEAPRLRAALRSPFASRSSIPAPLHKMVGFPLFQVGPRVDYPTISLGESLLIAWLPAAWLYALVSRCHYSDERVELSYTLAAAGVIVAVLIRVIIYCSGYRPPISLAGRLATGRWLIPLYDRVWLPPLCAAAAILSVNLLNFAGVRTFELGPLALGVGLSILLGMPPRLRDWALTGHHRIVADALARSEFIEI